VTENSKRNAGRLTGRDRALLYLVALRTGLRRGELQSLTIRSFDFSISPPTVTIEAAKSKHRRTDILPLSAEIAALLQPYLLDRSLGWPVWPGSWWRQASKMLAVDLTDAGISGADNNGRVVDFHALRTTFITGLARAGVMPAMAQKLARHSDINLTLGVYTQLQLSDLAKAVEKLPILAARAG
jgi:integrase